MIVVADSSPLIALVNIGKIQILAVLFGEVFVPEQIVSELADAKRPEIVREFIAAKPEWLRVATPASVEAIFELHEGERAAISLAMELKADLLLIDERSGREAARARHLAVTGTIGVLERAAELGLLELEDTFDRIEQTDFWVSPQFLDQELARFRARQDRH